MVSKGIQDCVDAFERIKAGTATNPKFSEITADRVTPSVVSQEAGFDSGYLKRDRPQHTLLITLIDDYKDEGKAKKAAGKSKPKANAGANNSEELVLMKKRLDEALGRELVLITTLREMEEELVELKKHRNAVSIGGN